jgi:hypothetical protein
MLFATDAKLLELNRFLPITYSIAASGFWATSLKVTSWQRTLMLGYPTQTPLSPLRWLRNVVR